VDAARATGERGKPARDSWAQAQFGPIIERLALEPLQQDFLRSRWLDQVRWMEGRAGACQRWYYRLRLITIAGGVVIAALVGLDIVGTVAVWVKWVVFGLGLLVALAASVEGFFRLVTVGATIGTPSSCSRAKAGSSFSEAAPMPGQPTTSRPTRCSPSGSRRCSVRTWKRS